METRGVPTPSMPAPDLSTLVVPLLKGVIYQESDAGAWNGLLGLQARVRDYVSVLGLELVLDEAEGYAFLRSPGDDGASGFGGGDNALDGDRTGGSNGTDDSDGTGGPGDCGSAAGFGGSLANDASLRRLPRLVARRPLSFAVSLLLALLRKKLAEFDASGGDTRLILSRDEVVELIRVFLPQGSNEARLIDQVDTHLNRIIELGFVRRLKSQTGRPQQMFEVRRILKAFVDAQWLANFDQRLNAYRAQLEAPAGDKSGRRGAAAAAAAAGNDDHMRQRGSARDTETLNGTEAG